MNAQDLIDQAETRPTWTRADFMATFYPEIYAQEQAELNLSTVVGK